MNTMLCPEEIRPESLSQREKEILEIYRNLDTVERICVIHKLYSIVSDSLLENALKEASLSKSDKEQEK